MPIALLVGDDTYKINQAIAQHKTKLDPEWAQVNTHCFDAANLKPEALVQLLGTVNMAARSLPLWGCDLLVVVENMTITADLASALDWLNHIPPTTNLILTAKSLDRRLKVSKMLVKLASVKEYNVLSPWATEAIQDQIEHQAGVFGLNLTPKIVAYLADAIGNDSARTDAELKKLQVYAGDRQLELTDVEQLVPNQTQNALQLATAVLTGNTTQVIELFHALQSTTHPMALIATLVTQFRTWLMVKSVLQDKTKRTDTEIAKLCGLGNPKRLYYLRQEVAKLNLATLVAAVTQLVNLDMGLRQGQADVLPELVRVAALIES